MSELLPVKVECYSGYKADEYPVRFYLNNTRIEIQEVIDRWYQYNKNSPFPAANYFKINTNGNKILILKQEIESGNCFLWVKGESIIL